MIALTLNLIDSKKPLLVQPLSAPNEVIINEALYFDRFFLNCLAATVSSVKRLLKNCGKMCNLESVTLPPEQHIPGASEGHLLALQCWQIFDISPIETLALEE